MKFKPYGISAIEAGYCSRLSVEAKKRNYAIWIWILTYMVYTSYHLSRKPISIVKNVLNENCSKLVPPEHTNNSHWCDWKPFDGDSSSSLLGSLDSAYLFTYAFGMFFSGFIAERTSITIFLSIGMALSGTLTGLFGLGYTFNIHVFWFYLLVQMVGGVVQSSGWPGVVATMGNWFGKKKRGFIMGIWNSHTSVGNILGTLIANAFITTGWDLSFIIPGAIIASLGVVVFFFLPADPSIVNLPNPNLVAPAERRLDAVDDERESLLPEYGDTALRRPQATSSSVSSENESRCSDDQPIGFCDALRIPGVVEFALCLFFAKLVSYTFLYWLPHFIYDSTTFDVSDSAKMSTFFDWGGIVGGIFAGLVSDNTGMPATTCTLMLIVAIPMMFIYQHLSVGMGVAGNIVILLVVGMLVNGPYALITTFVSAELGTHQSLRGSSKALATVTSIIDGTGSIGAAIGPLLAGVISNGGHWSRVFYMLMVSDALALVCLNRLLFKEIKQHLPRRSN